MPDPTDDADEVKRRLCRVMRYQEDDWLDRAERLLDAAWCQQQAKRIYDVSTVGYRIRAAREVMGMSQEQLALRMHVTGLTVGKWERGERNLKLEEARKLGLVLRPVCSKEWLFMASDEGGPDVPVHVLAKKHDPGWYGYRLRRRAFNAAKLELEKRRAARTAAQAANGDAGQLPDDVAP